MSSLSQARDPERVGRIRRLARPLSPEPTGMREQADPLPGIRAVLFDVYGTLLVSASGDVGTLLKGDRSGPLREALREAGFRDAGVDAAAQGVRRFHAAIAEAHEQGRAGGAAFPEVDVRRLWTGVLGSLAADGLLSRQPDPEAVVAIAVGYEMRVNPVWPMPGALRILRRLSRRALPLGIVSNAQFYTPLILEALLGASLGALGFDPALCAWSWIEGEAKPSARMFAPVLTELGTRGIPPDTVLYVGNDRRNDVAAAAGAGLRTALFAGDRRSLRLRPDDPWCGSVEPDRILTRLDTLEAVLR